MDSALNIADRLRDSAQKWPWQRAVVCPVGRDRAGRATYSQWTFRQLDEESDRLAWGLQRLGVQPGCRMVLMVRPSLEFIALTFALFKVGAVIVLIDPGMGRTNIFKCLEEVDPEGFIAVPAVHWIRTLSRKFPNAKLNVRVGGPWAPGCVATYRSLLGDDGRAKLLLSREPGTTLIRESGSAGASPSRPEPLEVEFPITRTQPTDPAAVIFTSGSTGPPKGVLYEHGMFNAQVDLLQQFYGIESGEVDLPGFPLFALFNAAMGVTTVIPDMDPTQPANVDSLKIIEAIKDNGVTQAFGSPALWNRVGSHCVEHGVELPSLRRALSAGGPVPIRVLEMMTKVLTGPIADLHTPYGATESLPVASIGAREVLTRTAVMTRQGAGTCVGRAFPGVDIRIITITEGPIASINDTHSLPLGEIGEIIVRSPAVTRQYFRRPDPTGKADRNVCPTRAAKIPDGDTFWHRIGDIGYLDAEGLLWFCGRKAHIVYTADGPMYSVCCEGIFDSHPQVFRSALVGIGPKGVQRPVLVVELMPCKGMETEIEKELQLLAQSSPLTKTIEAIEFIDAMPVDTRHNVKINREALSLWAKEQLKR